VILYGARLDAAIHVQDPRIDLRDAVSMQISSGDAESFCALRQNLKRTNGATMARRRALHMAAETALELRETQRAIDVRLSQHLPSGVCNGPRDFFL
jgi:hypothetical protein